MSITTQVRKRRINRYYDPATGQFVSVDAMVNETEQPYEYAGDNPVNGVDPTGLCTLLNGTYYPGNCASNRPQAIAAEKWTQSQGGGWSLTQAVHSELNYLAGVGNGIVSTVTFGQVHISAPYCGALRWAYGVGTGIGVAGTIVGAGGLPYLSTTLGDAAFESDTIGADSTLFANRGYGIESEEGLLNQRGSSWKLGWSSKMGTPVFRLSTPFFDHLDLLITSGFK